MAKTKKYYSKGETAAFYDGLDRRVRLDKNLTPKERKAWERGAKIHDSNDYKVAYRFTNHMNNSVTSIGSGAFAGCSSLESITLPFTGSTFGSSGSIVSCFGYIFGTDSYSGSVAVNQIYGSNSSYSVTYYIPQNLTDVTITGAIGDYAFSFCTMLKNVTIGYGLTSIGSYAFYNCSYLESVTLSNSITDIGSYAFFHCVSLQSIIIPTSVTFIGRFAFSGCTSLTGVTFKLTSTWYYASSSTATSGTTISSSDLSDPATAVTYLTSSYVSYYWLRT